MHFETKHEINKLYLSKYNKNILQHRTNIMHRSILLFFINNLI